MNPYSFTGFTSAPIQMKVFYHYLEHNCDEYGLFVKTDSKTAFKTLMIPPDSCKGIGEALSDLLLVGESHLLLLNKVKDRYYKSRKYDREAIRSYSELFPDWWSRQIKSKAVRISDSPAKSNGTLEERKTAFKKRVAKAIKELIEEGKPGLTTENAKKFVEYWTEHNDESDRMRFEKKDTFNVKMRIAKWR